MKKSLSVILLICVVFSFTRCAFKKNDASDPKPYESYYVGECPCLEDICATPGWDVIVEKNKRTSLKIFRYYKDEDIQTFLFDGVDTELFAPTMYHGTYFFDDTFSAMYDSKTDDVLFMRKLNVLQKDYDAVLNGTAISEDEALEYAKKLASKHVNDIDSYTCQITKISRAYQKEKLPYYEFFFDKDVLGYETNEYINIIVGPSGSYQEYALFLCGEFDDVDISIDAARISESIEQKLHSTFDTDSTKYLNRSDGRQVLCITPEGYIGIATIFKCHVQDCKKDAEVTHTIVIFTVIDEFEL